MKCEDLLTEIDEVMIGLKEQLKNLNEIREKIIPGKDVEEIEWKKNDRNQK